MVWGRDIEPFVMAIRWTALLFVSLTLSLTRGSYEEVSLLVLVDERSDELVSDCTTAIGSGGERDDMLFNFTIILESEVRCRSLPLYYTIIRIVGI